MAQAFFRDLHAAVRRMRRCRIRTCKNRSPDGSAGSSAIAEMSAAI